MHFESTPGTGACAGHKVELKCLLRLPNAILVCSNYIPHTFNPFGDVTMSYLLWPCATISVAKCDKDGKAYAEKVN